MNNSQMQILTTAIVFCLSANAGAAALNNHASGVYTDGKVEFRLPENSIPLDKQKCERDAVARVPASLPSFKCEKVQHNSKEYLILKNTESKGKQKWQFKIFTMGNQVTELGDLNAEYAVVPLLVDSKQLEFLAVNIDTWSQWKKEDRKVSYERYKVGESGAPSLMPIMKSGMVAKNAMSKSEYLDRSAADPSAKGSNEATIASDSEAAAIIRSSATPPPGSPSNDVIEKAVKKELHNNVPERWVKMTLQGKRARFQLIEIIQWGKVTTAGVGRKSYPVRIRVAGSATVIPPFGSVIPVIFDDIAEFRFIENDFGEWEHSFKRPNLFGG